MRRLHERSAAAVTEERQRGLVRVWVGVRIGVWVRIRVMDGIRVRVGDRIRVRKGVRVKVRVAVGVGARVGGRARPVAHLRQVVLLAVGVVATQSELRGGDARQLVPVGLDRLELYRVELVGALAADARETPLGVGRELHLLGLGLGLGLEVGARGSG